MKMSTSNPWLQVKVLQRHSRFTGVGMSSVVFMAALLAPVSGNAYDYVFKKGVKVDVASTATYGLMYRLKDPEADNVSQPSVGSVPGRDFKTASLAPSANDGNLNFDKGLVASRLSIISEMKFQFHNVGLFVRGRAWYDSIYSDGDTDFPDDPNVTYNGRERGKFQEETEDYLGQNAEFLDAFIYGDFKLKGHTFDLRLGRQVISWGESLFFQNGISSAQNPVDANSGTAAGVEVKEIFLPTGAFSMRVDINDRLDLEAYVQYEHQEIVMNPSGSFFSEFDFLGEGGTNFINSGLNQNLIRKDIDVDEDGQFGIAFRYLTAEGVEWGAYHVVSHDKAISYELDLSDTNPVPGSPEINGAYTIFFTEDVRLYGLSYGTVWGQTNVGGEVSYRPNASIVTGSVVPTTSRNQYVQAQFNTITVLDPTSIYDAGVLIYEIVAWKFPGLEDSDLDPSNMSSGWAHAVSLELDYKTVMDGLDLKAKVFFEHGVDGTNFRANARHEANRLALGLKAIYLFNFEASIDYTMYDGRDNFGSKAYTLRDRDNVAISVKYSF